MDGRAYTTSFQRFTAFCTTIGFLVTPSSPVPEQILCQFICSLAASRSGQYIRNELAAIQAFHIINNLPFPDSVRLRYLLKAANKLTPSLSCRSPRQAVSISMLDFLSTALTLSSPFDICCFAVACTAFWGQARLGELLPSSISKLDSSRYPDLSNLQPPSTPAGSRTLRIPFSKTTGSAGASLFLCRQHGPSDAILALSRHISLNSPATGPLFSFRRNNILHPLTKSHFLSRVTSLLEPAGFPHISGHSFRIGGTTELLLRKVDPQVVRVMGRWSSDSFLRYWRSIDLLAPLHAELLQPT
jgi:hypothetical protein